MAQLAKLTSKFRVNLTNNWCLKTSSISYRNSFFALKPFDAPEIYLQSIVLDVLRDSVWILKIQLQVKLTFSVIDHLPSQVKSVFIRVLTRGDSEF